MTTIIIAVAVTAIITSTITLFLIKATTNSRNASQSPDDLRNQFEINMRRMQEEHNRQLMQWRTEDARREKEMRESVALMFKQMANESLNSHLKEIRATNRHEMDAILNPLRQKIDDFYEAVSKTYVSENASRQSLSDQIERLMKLNATIGTEARNLTSALKGDTRFQGRWGEIILETILENAGLKRDVNFFTQLTKDDSGRTLKDEAENGLRPDVVILLPGNHKLVVDSKVSLNAYVDYTGASDDSDKAEAAKAHVRSVRHHVDELHQKCYQKYIGNAVDHVLMFMPNEGAYLAAIDIDPGLWDYAFRKKVVIVSPAHIMSVVQLIAQLWQQERQNRNALKIAELGGLLHDKFVAFSDEMSKIETELTRAQKAYNVCFNHLTSGNTSLVARAGRLRDLGAAAKKDLSNKLTTQTLTADADTDDQD